MRLTTALVPLLFLSALSEAQPQQAAAVHIVVTAEPHKGDTIPALNREDIQVHSGNDRLQVADFTPLQGDRGTLQLFILMDDSSSTSLGIQLNDIRAFINAQPATTAVAIGYMRNGTVDTVQNFTNDHRQAAAKLRLPLGSIGASASPYFSLMDLIKRWPSGAPRREIVLMSDGIDRFGGNGPANPYVDQTVDQAQRAGIVIYTIYVSGVGHRGHSFWSVNWGQNYLSQIAEQTGGEAYFQGFQTPVSLGPFLTQISQRLGRQYLLGFFPKPQAKPGFERIRLRTEVPNVDLAAQESVYVAGNK